MADFVYLVWEDNQEEYELHEVKLRGVFNSQSFNIACDFADTLCKVRQVGSERNPLFSGNNVYIATWCLESQKEADVPYVRCKAEEANRTADEVRTRLLPMLEERLQKVNDNFDAMTNAEIARSLRILNYSDEEIQTLTSRKE